ncbi:hypothetical protein SNEBB_003951 [Seison nebaliae]|nr:hypothetical protein SNEBB_003951 [Seison nebaliae]
MLKILLKLNPLIKNEIDLQKKTYEIWTHQNISKAKGFTMRIIEDIANMINLNFILNITNEFAYGLEDATHHHLTGLAGQSSEYDIIGLLNSIRERRKYLEFIKILEVHLNFNYNENNEALYSPFNRFIRNINYRVFILAFFLSILSIILLYILNDKCLTIHKVNQNEGCICETKKSLTEIRKKWILIFGNFRNINIKLNIVWKIFQISWWFGAIIFSSQVIALFISIITKLQHTDLTVQQIFDDNINFLVNINSTTSAILRNFVSSQRIIEVDDVLQHTHRLEKGKFVIASFGDYSTFLKNRYCNIKEATYQLFFPAVLGLAMRKNHPLIDRMRYKS